VAPQRNAWLQTAGARGTAPAPACPLWPPPTGPPREPVRRYERAHPGELIHIDVEKLGGIPDSGGHKVLGRAVGRAHQDRRNGTGYACLHTALDDHSGPAYTEHLPDEKAVTCAAFLRRAVA
jgi:hypothetical protein